MAELDQDKLQDGSSETATDAPAESSQQDVQGTDESSRLRALDADIRDQDDLERDITRQVCWPLDMFHPPDPWADLN